MVSFGMLLGIVVTIHKMHFSKYYLFFCFQQMNDIFLSFDYLHQSLFCKISYYILFKCGNGVKLLGNSQKFAI